MRSANLKTAWTLISVALLFGIAGEVVLEFVVKDVKWEGRVIVIVLLMLVVAFIYVALVVSKLLEELRSQHRAATYVTSMIGLAEAAKMYAESGGSDLDFRLKIHDAMKEQYTMYLQALEGVKSPKSEPELAPDAPVVASPA